MQRYPTTNPQEEFNRIVDVSKLNVDYTKYKNVTGKDLFKRVSAFSEELLTPLRQQQLILYERRNMSAPAQECYGMDDYGNIFYGLNFASADYLGLCTDPTAKEAAMLAAQDYSVNSCGAPLAFGASKYYMQLKEELKEFWHVEDVILYSAGWLGGFGVIKGLIRPYDFVIMDELAHNCLSEGAFAATKNVIRTPHLDIAAIEQNLKSIRSREPDSCILVVTEGLFSMDSDYVDLVALQKITKKYEAFLLIDCAHDFGCMGENGRGIFEVQGLKDFSNVILMAGGSKCLSTNLGWIGCTKGVVDYLKFFSSAYMFTNSVNPVQCATALAQLRILRGEYGKRLRKQVLQNYHYVKDELVSKGFKIIGNPSPILPLFIGNEVVCRLVTRLMLDEGVHCNGIEYPIVKSGKARLRINLQPQHTKEQMDIFIATFEFCYQKANVLFQKSLENFQIKQEELEAEEAKRKSYHIGMNEHIETNQISLKAKL